MIRFLAKVEFGRTPGDCWRWKPTCYRSSFRMDGGVRGRVVDPHVAAWLIVWGTIPRGKVIGHTCGNYRCPNPGHLVARTKTENARSNRRVVLTPDLARRIQQFRPRPYQLGGPTLIGLAKELGVKPHVVYSARIGGQNWQDLNGR